MSAETDDDKGNLIDFESTTEDGAAKVKCFALEPCVIEAKKWLKIPLESAKPEVAASLKHRLEAGRDAVSIALTLTEKRDRFSVSSEGDLNQSSQT